MKKLGAVLATLLVIGMLAVFSTAVYAQTTIDGFSETLQALLGGFQIFVDAVVEVFKLVL